MLQAHGLTKRYGTQAAVDGVSLDLHPGRIMGLVGNNGAGKTTTIKMLAGLLEPSAGQVRLEGQDPQDAPVRARIGYLPEESAVYEDETPLSYLAFFADLYGLPRASARERARALLARLRLDERGWTQDLGTFSKGMRRKVSIARALLHDPAVLLLDEATSGLDPATDRELTTFIRELRAEGKAILLSAHNLPQIEELCDDILLMDAGRVVARGTLDELRKRWGKFHYRIRATKPFPGSAADGPHFTAALETLADVETALDAVRRADGTVLHVESVPPRLDEILSKAAQTGPAAPRGG